jgi:ribosomal protein L29
MKLLLMATMMLGGGTVAATNEDVQATVTKTFEHAKQFVQQKRVNQIENLKESGFQYPSEEYLSSLTEEQAFTIVSTIDQINATYNFSEMTDEEIQAALVEIKAELQALYTELGIDGPQVQTRLQQGKLNNEANKGASRGTRGTQDGTGSQDGSCDLNTDSDTL